MWSDMMKLARLLSVHCPAGDEEQQRSSHSGWVAHGYTPERRVSSAPIRPATTVKPGRPDGVSTAYVAAAASSHVGAALAWPVYLPGHTASP